MEIKEFIRLNLVYVLYIIGVFLGWNIIILYFSRMGYNYIEISSYFLVLSLTSFIFLIFPQNLNIKKSINYSQILRVASFFLVMEFLFKSQIYIVAIITALAIELFWIPYLTKAKQYESNKERKKKIRNVIRLGSFIKAIVPFLGGLIAAKMGFFPLFLICIFLFLLNIEGSSSLGEGNIKWNVMKALKLAKKVKTMLFLEGLWQSIPFIIIPLITLRYVQLYLPDDKQIIYFGLYFSFVSTVSVLAYHITKRIDNKDKKYYLYPLTLSLGLVTVFASLATGYKSWIALTGIIVLTWKMSERFTDTLIKKRTREIPNMIVIRRFFISLGRITGTLITIFTISIFGIHNLEFALRLIGVIFLSYPIVLYYKR